MNRSYKNRQNEEIVDKVVSQSLIKQSGNSDVDVEVDVTVDTTPIAYAMLYSMRASNQMTPGEFDTAVRHLRDFTKNGYVRGVNDVSNVRLFHTDTREGRRRK